MLRDFWFQIFLFVASIMFGFVANYSEGNIRRIYLSLAVIFSALACLSYIWGDPVRGPFAGLTHPNAPNEFRFHAGATAKFPIKELSRGIDFSRIINMPNNPINLKVSRTWWSGWRFDIKLKTMEGYIEINNKKHQIIGLPTGFDYNSDDYAVEIVDSEQKPVFQLIQDLDYDIYLNAVFGSQDRFIMMNGNLLALSVPKSKVESNRSRAIFKYPAYMNRGKRL